MTKEQRLIKKYEAQIEQMSTDYAEQSRNAKMYSDQSSRLQDELEDMHLTLDVLGVPRSLKGTYRDMTLSARFVLFLAQRSGILVKQDPNEENCDR